jgi:Flp pilus assembly protein TadG
MTRAALTRFAAQTRATTSVEFALVGSMMLMATFGTLDLGILLWTQNALQSTASLAARCAAISSPLCTDVPSYAADLANYWIMSGAISAGDVRVTSVGTCNGASGSFQQVTITSSLWANALPWPFSAMTQTISACYPKL